MGRSSQQRQASSNAFREEDVILLLSRAERELVESRRTTELAFLHGIPQRASAVLTITLPVVGLLLSTASLVVVPILSSLGPKALICVVILGGSSLILLTVALWMAVIAISPTGLALLPVTEDFVEQCYQQIGESDKEATVHRLVAELIRDDSQNNRRFIDDRMKSLGLALNSVRAGYVFAILLVVTSVYLRSTINPGEDGKDKLKPSNDPKVGRFPGTPAPSTPPPDSPSASAGKPKV